MADQGRARRIADRIKEIIAANLTQVVKDPDLGFVTITEVRVTGDLQHASVFYTVMGDEAARERSAQILAAHQKRLRSFVGARLGIRLTPTLDLIPDAVPESAEHIEELLRSARERDAELAAGAAGAGYAGDADPYRVGDQAPEGRSGDGGGSTRDG